MNLPPLEVCRRILALWVLLGSPDWTENDRVRLFNLLAENGQSINDLPPTFQAVGVIAAPSRPKDKLYERIWRLFGQLDSDNEPTRKAAREKLDRLLKDNDLEWNGPNGFTAILVSYWADNNVSPNAATVQATTDDELQFNALDFLMTLLDDYHVMSATHRLIAALWGLLTHVYEQFEKTPLLLLISPTSGYGKTKLIQLLKQICYGAASHQKYHSTCNVPSTCT